MDNTNPKQTPEEIQNNKRIVDLENQLKQLQDQIQNGSFSNPGFSTGSPYQVKPDSNLYNLQEDIKAFRLSRNGSVDIRYKQSDKFPVPPGSMPNTTVTSTVPQSSPGTSPAPKK